MAHVLVQKQQYYHLLHQKTAQWNFLHNMIFSQLKKMKQLILLDLGS